MVAKVKALVGMMRSQKEKKDNGGDKSNGESNST